MSSCRRGSPHTPASLRPHRAPIRRYHTAHRLVSTSSPKQNKKARGGCRRTHTGLSGCCSSPAQLLASSPPQSPRSKSAAAPHAPPVPEEQDGRGPSRLPCPRARRPQPLTLSASCTPACLLRTAHSIFPIYDNMQKYRSKIAGCTHSLTPQVDSRRGTCHSTFKLNAVCIGHSIGISYHSLYPVSWHRCPAL